MATSQNGYTAFESYPNPLLHKWQLQLKGEDRHFVLRDGPAGFILVHFILWFHDKIEAINRGTWDDWAYAPRNIRGSSSVVSNHASGTAVDINATKHPMGLRGTFARKWQYTKIRFILRTRYRGCIRWGADYTDRADEMHFEINADRFKVARVTKRLRDTPRGKRVLRQNPYAERR